MKKYQKLLLLYLVFFFVFTLSAQSALHTGALQLVLIDAETGIPKAGIPIDFHGSAESTDLFGEANFQASEGYNLLKVMYGSNPEKNIMIEANQLTRVILYVAQTDKATHWEITYCPFPEALSEKTRNVEKGTLEGEVFDMATENPLYMARTNFSGIQETVETNQIGAFSVGLPEGECELLSRYPNYPVKKMTVAIKGGKTINLQIPFAFDDNQELYAQKTITTEMIAGEIESMIEERRYSAEVTEVLGKEEMSKSGDSDAAGSLKRVTGLSVVGGKYVYVRGMGERYSSSLLNGSSLPSSEPDRRVVPLDIFPTGIVQDIVVQKSYSPDLPGEFGGGTVQIQTEDIPSKLFLDVSFSSSFSDDTTGKSGLMYDGGNRDWLGFDDGTRALPGIVKSATGNGKITAWDPFSQRGYTNDQLEAFGESMPNEWTPSHVSIPPNFGVAAGFGNTWSLGKLPLGVALGVQYGNNWDMTSKELNIYRIGSGNKIQDQHNYDLESLKQEVSLGGVLNLGTELGQWHKLKLTSMVLRTTEDQTRIYQGMNRDVDTQIRVTRLQWIENMMMTNQLTGKHLLGPKRTFIVDWRYTMAIASRDEPDRRETRYDLEESNNLWYLSDRPEGNQRLYSELDDFNNDLGLDITVPFLIEKSVNFHLKTGAAYLWRDREVDTRRFKYQHKGPRSYDQDLLSRLPEEIFTPENIGSDGFQFEEITRPTDNYEADQTTTAAYLMTGINVKANLSITAGVRFEQSKQEVKTYELFNPDSQPVYSRLDHDDWLPAVSTTWKFRKRMQLRINFSQTVSRPDFRELSPATYDEITGGRQIFGNPDLERSLISNFDARWEWYPKSRWSFSIGAFYKDFYKPIETVVIPGAQHSVSYDNAKGAYNLGAELEFRAQFAESTRFLHNLYYAGNLSFIHSRVTLDDSSGIQTSNSRPLQGQSPYVVNLRVGYENADWGFHTALLYNVFGKRIAEVGAEGLPDVYEQPFHQLDFVLRKRLWSSLCMSLKAKNLLNSEVEYLQGGHPTERYLKGREFSLCISYKL